jgi:hypothetical protein
MGYTATRSHEANVSWLDNLHSANTVPVLDLSFKKISQGAQSDMRMLVYVYVFTWPYCGRAHVIDECERPNLSFFSEGEQTSYYEVPKVGLSFVYQEIVVGHVVLFKYLVPLLLPLAIHIVRHLRIHGQNSILV